MLALLLIYYSWSQLTKIEICQCQALGKNFIFSHNYEKVQIIHLLLPCWLYLSGEEDQDAYDINRLKKPMDDGTLKEPPPPVMPKPYIPMPVKEKEKPRKKGTGVTAAIYILYIVLHKLCTPSSSSGINSIN